MLCSQGIAFGVEYLFNRPEAPPRKRVLGYSTPQHESKIVYFSVHFGHCRGGNIPRAIISFRASLDLTLQRRCQAMAASLFPWKYR
jgi:hypothetical protein